MKPVPCNKCGTAEFLQIRKSESLKIRWMCCENCGAASSPVPMSQGEDAAVATWNKDVAAGFTRMSKDVAGNMLEFLGNLRKKYSLTEDEELLITLLGTAIAKESLGKTVKAVIELRELIGMVSEKRLLELHSCALAYALSASDTIVTQIMEKNHEQQGREH